MVMILGSGGDGGGGGSGGSDGGGDGGGGGSEVKGQASESPVIGQRVVVAIAYVDPVVVAIVDLSKISRRKQNK
ncbi:hypothetical protein E2C01_083055 [Portunus trituberculatus]|uniref:Uncharacterized protein n=1 Tax=Portunus trituberculatus TaxID=210409 RepID=A0A5B7IRG6_PORTR|nr:hypothetical protein [Portunus trituberculatus]